MEEGNPSKWFPTAESVFKADRDPRASGKALSIFPCMKRPCPTHAPASITVKVVSLTRCYQMLCCWNGH